VRFERTTPATSVVIPPTFVDSRRIGPDTRLLPIQTEARTTMKTRIRFQLPPSVLPMTIEEARLSLRLVAPLREVKIDGWVDGKVIPLGRLSSPIGTEQINLTDPRLLQVDKRGCLYINIEVGDVRSGVDRDMWHLEWANLAVRGRTRDQGEGRP
jgi:hypothetical protein